MNAASGNSTREKSIPRRSMTSDCSESSPASKERMSSALPLFISGDVSASGMSADLLAQSGGNVAGQFSGRTGVCPVLL